MDKVEIYQWLKAKNYQTEYEETGEYRMYFEVDMPEILEAYYEWKVKKLNEPAVSNNEVAVEHEKHKCINCEKEYKDIDDAIMCCYVSETDC